MLEKISVVCNVLIFLRGEKRALGCEGFRFQQKPLPQRSTKAQKGFCRLFELFVLLCG
jgi:hypothetical protein